MSFVVYSYSFELFWFSFHFGPNATFSLVTYCKMYISCCQLVRFIHRVDMASAFVIFTLIDNHAPFPFPTPNFLIINDFNGKPFYCLLVLFVSYLAIRLMQIILTTFSQSLSQHNNSLCFSSTLHSQYF